MILIIGNSVDLAKSVTDEVDRLSGEEIVFFKADKCLEGESFSFSNWNGRPQIIANIDGKEIDLDLVRMVWYWKPILPKILRTLEPSKDALFVYRQFLAMWRSVVSLLKDKQWLNDYYRMIAAEHKPYQLQMASKLGFYVTDTLITSDPLKAREFWENCNKEVVIKPLMMSPTENSMLFANRLSEELMAESDRLRSAPVILQRLLPHKHELRITVVGDQIFPAEVISESKLDWRRSKIQLKPYPLPNDITQLCFDYLKAMGLQYGCIDMIVTPNNEYAFLEINPNGQWDFVEKRAGMPIGKAIANLLVRR